MRIIAMFLSVTLATLVVGITSMHVQKAQADPASNIAAVGPQSFPPSLVQKAACGGWGPHCRPGWTWVCGPYHRHCWCARC
jgi:hypothetical protein